MAQCQITIPSSVCPVVNFSPATRAHLSIPCWGGMAWSGSYKQMAMSTWSVVVQFCSASCLGRMHLGLFAGIRVLVRCILGHTELVILTASKTFETI